LLPFCVLLGLAALAAHWRSVVLAGEGSAPAAPGPTALSAAAAVDPKLQVRREGTLLRDEPGRFVASGNRLTFVTSDGTTYVGLENLNLQRISKVVAASPDPVQWFVSGTLTEFDGLNYLLVSHVRRRSAVPKPRGF
jgi:hypothetical protein